MLLERRWLRIVFGTVVIVALVGVALYEINEWWPGCNFARKFAANGEPLIAAAARTGFTGCVCTLLRRGADPNVNDGEPLLAAVANGNYRTARLLLKRGARVNAGAGARTALCRAMGSLEGENPDDRMVELLMNSGAALQWKGDAGMPNHSVMDCLHHFDSGPGPSVEAKRFAHLVDHGFVDMFNNSSEEYQFRVMTFLYDDEIKQLGEHGAKFNLDARYRDGQTLLTRLNVAMPGLSAHDRLLASQSLCARIRLLVSEGAQYAPQDADAVKRCSS